MLHSSFWLDDADLSSLEPTDPEFLIRLSSIRRAIANFVLIATGRDIPVRFSTGDQSYAHSEDGYEEKDFVVIGATTDPIKFDAQAGIALHEGAHILLSKKTTNPDSIPLFPLLKALYNSPELFYHRDYNTIERDLKRLKLENNDIARLFKTILNVLEDRRIDKWMYQNNIGYRGYYEAMYSEIWHSERTNLMFESEQVKKPTLEAYMFHLINMTNKNARSDYLPGLKEIWDVVQLENIERFVRDVKWETWYSMFEVRANNLPECIPDMGQTVLKIAEIILRNCATLDNQEEQSSSPDPEAEVDENNLDIPDGEPESAEADDLKELVEQLENILDGNITLPELNDEAADMMDVLEQAGAQLKETGGEIGRARVIVYQKLDASMVREKNKFPFSNGQRNTDIRSVIDEGEIMGNILAHRLQVMMEETPITYNRLYAGRIDKRRVYGLGFEAEDVFSQTYIERHDPVLLHLSIDSSGSMFGEKWKHCMKLAACLAKAAEKIPHFDVTISFRTSGYKDHYIHVLMAYDSRTDTFNKIRSVFPFLRAAGGTPEGLAFEAIKDQILISHRSSRLYFVNLSDGQPDYDWPGDGAFSYSGAKAFEHTRQQIEAMRQNGIQILSYFIGSTLTTKAGPANNGFQRMYGKDSAFIDPESITAIAQTLNRLFLG